MFGYSALHPSPSRTWTHPTFALPSAHYLCQACPPLSTGGGKPTGSPLFSRNPLVACCRYQPRKFPHSPCQYGERDAAFSFRGTESATSTPEISGLMSCSHDSGLQPPCLRFAEGVTPGHARLGAELLSRLCSGHHFRWHVFLKLAGRPEELHLQPPSDPYVNLSIYTARANPSSAPLPAPGDAKMV